MQSLPGIAVFQCVKWGVSPLLHLKLPRSSVSERPIQKYFSDLIPVRLIRKVCSFLQGETVFIHRLLVCNINLSGTEECQHDPKTTAPQWSSDKTLVVFKLQSKEFQEGQISRYRWRHLLHHKLLLPWASSSILLFSRLFKSLRWLKQTSKAGLSCQLCYLSPLKAVMLLRGHRASGPWQECR